MISVTVSVTAGLRNGATGGPSDRARRLHSALILKVCLNWDQSRWMAGPGRTAIYAADVRVARRAPAFKRYPVLRPAFLWTGKVSLVRTSQIEGHRIFQ